MIAISSYYISRRTLITLCHISITVKSDIISRQKMTYKIAEMTGQEYLRRIKENPTVIIPTGACEIYGKHLPLGSDILIAEKVAEMLADKLQAVVAPVIQCGESSSLRAFPCTFPMPKEVMDGYIRFLMEKLLSDGVKNFIFVTGHAGNVPIIDYVIRTHTGEGIKACQFDFWRMTNALSGDIFDYKGGHAAECGTSVMMYLYPELVDMESYEGCAPRKDDFPEFTEYASFTEKTATGCIGFAEKANPEKGERIINAVICRMMEYLSAKGFVRS